MGGTGEVEQLKEELRRTRARLTEIQAISERRSALPLRERLLQEKKRCERYNHFFSLVTLASEKTQATDISRRLGSQVRSSDTLGIVDSSGLYHRVHRFRDVAEGTLPALNTKGKGMVGIILPETDRKGAESAVRRLSGVLTGEDRVKIGLAVYPDDGSNVEELHVIASRPADGRDSRA